MKILIVNTHDIQGGAARAAYRLHKALNLIGAQSEMLVQYKASDEHQIIGRKNKYQKLIASCRTQLDKLLLYPYKPTQQLFSPALIPFSSIVKEINNSDADIVHLHWVASGMLHINDIVNIKKPIVWSLHDMWAFTGGCHYNGNCMGFKQECGACPVLHSNKKKDLSFYIADKKTHVYSQLGNQLTVVGLSRWLAITASSSKAMSSTRVVNLPNPIDTNSFSPMGKNIARGLLQLNTTKKVILFGAMNATEDVRKGYAQLIGALKNYKNKNQIVCIIVGSSKPKNLPEIDIEMHYLGKLTDDITLNIVYNAADVMVVPSLQENLSNTIMESLSCGTPVVAFDIGGNADLINHKENGFLADPYNEVSLSNGISWVLDSDSEFLRNNARNKVVECFDMKIVAKKYQLLYEDILLKRVVHDVE